MDDPSQKYVPPPNALTELSLCVPENLRSAFEEVVKEVETENPVGDWPDVPYHYGMGRIRAYEEWLASLDEVSRRLQLLRTRQTYEAFNQRSADLALRKMAERNLDLSEYMAEYKERERRRLRIRGILDAQRERNDFGPTLGGGRSR